MQLEDYFVFDDPEEIRIRGHRILLEHVLYEYIHNAKTFEELVDRFDTLSKDEILAVLLYYHRNQEALDKYLADYLEYCHRSRREFDEQNQGWIDSMRRRMEEFRARKHSELSA